MILKWIKKPYFFELPPKVHLSLAFGVGFFIFLFIYLFQPFGMANLGGNLFLYSLGFGLVTFSTQAILFVLIPLIFKNYFRDENWTIGKNILFLLLLVSCISLGNWLYNNKFQNTENTELLTLEKIFTYTYTISIFPIFIFTYFSEYFYRQKREKVSSNIMAFKVSTTVEVKNESIKIIGDNNKENITFNLDNLVYINSQGNYVCFYICTNKGIEEKILRNTLTNVNSNLKKYSNIIKCHKSYIINTKFMDSISGNARGYFLESKKISKPIPVSRSYPIEKLKDLIN